MMLWECGIPGKKGVRFGAPRAARDSADALRIARRRDATPSTPDARRPPQSLWEGATYTLVMIFDEEYPRTPPKCSSPRRRAATLQASRFVTDRRPAARLPVRAPRRRRPV